MNGHVELVRHFLGALAYRLHKAIQGAPAGFSDFAAGDGVRTPHQLIRHINGVLSYAWMVVQPGNADSKSHLEALSWKGEVDRFCETLSVIDRDLQHRSVPVAVCERLLQGPLADAMTHVGQIAMLRRLAGSPIPAENFFKAEIRKGRFGPDQADPVSPD